MKILVDMPLIVYSIFRWRYICLQICILKGVKF